jgi:O-acetylhomoserine (thiol)-lyase
MSDRQQAFDTLQIHASVTRDPATGDHPDIMVLSIGIEDADDIIADLDQTLTKATA